MKIVIQKVKKATLYSEGQKFSNINFGLLILIGIANEDTMQTAQKMADKILKLRIFDDANGKTNLDIFQANGEIMLVSNFTLYGNLKGTNRPDFKPAARPEIAEPIYNEVLKILQNNIKTVSGVFRTDMEIEMIAEGPNTYIYEIN